MEENNNEVQNDYNEPSKNGNSKILLLIVIVFALIGIGLTFYKVLVLDKKQNENKQEERINENKQEEKVDVIGIIKSQVLNVPLFNISDKITYKDIYEAYIIENAMSKMTSQKSLTDEELEKTIFKTMDNGMFADLTKDTRAVYYNGNEVIAKVKELYNYDLKLDKEDYGGCQIASLNSSCIITTYDKEIDKFIYLPNGGVVGNYRVIITNESNENNLYKVDYILINYYNGGEGNNCFTSIEEDMSCDLISDDAKIEKYAKEHKDELPQYEVLFKIDGNNYSFVDIKKVN